MVFNWHNFAVSSILSISVTGSLLSPRVRAQTPPTQIEPMSKQEFALSLKQAALTVCALRKLDMNYKLALKTSAVPVFQLVKHKYGMDIVGVNEKLEDERLIRYLGYKISEVALLSCKEILPTSVGSWC